MESSNKSSAVHFKTRLIDTAHPLPYSAAHLIPTVLGRIWLSLQWVMFTGFGGLFGSTPGLLVGIGFGSCTIFPFTWTCTLGGNSSAMSFFPVSNDKTEARFDKDSPSELQLGCLGWMQCLWLDRVSGWIGSYILPTAHHKEPCCHKPDNPI